MNPTENNRPIPEERTRMHAVSDADTHYAGTESPTVSIQSRSARRSGDLPLGLALARPDGPAAFQEGAVLGTESRRAIGADAVGELHTPAAPRHDALNERIAVIARMPRAATEEHHDLLKFSPFCCNGYASLDRDHHDADLPRTLRVGWENLSSVARALVGKNFGRRAPAPPRPTNEARLVQA